MTVKNNIRILVLILIMINIDYKIILAQNNFKILSYNVLYGLQNDSLIKKDYIKWVNSISPDIVAYQEMNSFTQKSLEQFALLYGHPYAVLSKTEGFPVALTSRYPIVDVQKVVDNMHHVYLYANVKNINIFVIHFSPFSYQKRQFEVTEVLARAALISNKERIIIMGDFNSLSRSDSSEYNEDALNAQIIREKKENHIRNLKDGKFDYSVTNSMEDAGYKDLVRGSHSDFQFSVPTKKYGEKYLKRIDFIWVNSRFKKDAISADIIRDEVTNRISDHYPVLATFRLK